MISWKDVEVAYGGRVVLGPVTVTVDDGDWVGLIGPNGAGKSTMIKAALGLVEMKGSVEVRNGKRRPGLDIAWMPQRPTMPAEMGVGDYVMLGRTPHIGFLGSEGRGDHVAVERSLNRLDLEPFRDRTLHTLSGGEAQRAVLARAIAQEAPVLLLDEPTANLDIGHGLEVLEVVDGLRRADDLTVVTAIHDLTLAGRFCTRLVLLSGRHVVADGPPRQVLTESVLRPHYGDSIRVIEDRDGPVVIPARTTR